MWEDEMYFEDDESAMAAYEEAIQASKDGDYGGGAMSDDDDFEPASSSRRGKAKSQRSTVPKSKTASGMKKPRKPRVASGMQSSSPAPVPPVHPGMNGIESDDVDIDGEAERVTASANITAIPTPDIGTLKVSSSAVGSPSLD
ncbi:hypothetical protein H4R23_001085, partial [Coemansia sp. Cherry 401B]